MDACAAMGEHRREHTRERSDGQAQMAENRPNAGAPHATRSDDELTRPIGANTLQTHGDSYSCKSSTHSCSYKISTPSSQQDYPLLAVSGRIQL